MKTVSSQEISESDKYDHEIVRPETKAMFVLRWVGGTIFLILPICLLILCIREILKATGSGFDKFMFFILSSPICLWLLYFTVKTTIVNLSRNRLAISDKELLIHAPKFGVGQAGGLIKLSFPIHEIVGASIRNRNSPELKCIMQKDKKCFKILRNADSFSVFTDFFSPFQKPRTRYRYIFCVDTQPISDDTQFVEIEFQGGWKILVEFDDVENFINVLKRRISQNKQTAP